VKATLFFLSKIKAHPQFEGKKNMPASLNKKET
jgi:hypothetical protein